MEGIPTPPLGKVGTDDGNEALAPPVELLLEDELLLDDELLEDELGLGMLGTDEEEDCDGV